jgi:hypothetical protein
LIELSKWRTHIGYYEGYSPQLSNTNTESEKIAGS